jgi:16S rRNA G966 N2-methylase RsmD
VIAREDGGGSGVDVTHEQREVLRLRLEADVAAGAAKAAREDRTVVKHFVEFRPSSLHALRANVVRIRMRDRSRIFKRDAVQFAAALEADAYDIAFVDPPYESRQLDLVLASWKASGFARVLVAEHARTHKLPPGTSQRVFDDTTITTYRR